MFAAEQRGLDDVLATLRRFARIGLDYQRREVFWQPAACLEQMTHTGRGFSSRNTLELP
jgi:hypothetical protein